MMVVDKCGTGKGRAEREGVVGGMVGSVGERGVAMIRGREG